MIVLTSNLGSEYLAALPDGASADDRARAGDGGGPPRLPAGVPEPARRDHPVQPAGPGADEGHRRRSSSGACASCWPTGGSSLELERARRCDWLANAGYDPVYGARPLKRVIQRELQDPLALMLLEGRLGDGETVRVDAGDGGLVIQGTPGARRPRPPRTVVRQPA